MSHQHSSQVLPALPVVPPQPNSVTGYPSPAASYEEVVASPETFMATLGELHRFMGSKLVIPTIGGKSLDLHQLFVEVTARGGLEKVIRDRKWRDVVSLFSFPHTITNASFLLRKHYISLLQGYEQIYFFNSRSELPSPEHQNSTTKSPASTSPVGQCGIIGPTKILEEETAEKPLKVGSSIIGTINGKFEEGYLVTVDCGSEILQGILYHCAFSSPKLSRSPTSVSCRQQRRKKKKRFDKDPSRPKSNRSGYNFFFAEQYARLKPSFCGEEKSMTRKIGHLWSNLTDVEREVYQEKGLKDKERYRSEMLEYKRSKSSSN